MPTTERQVLLVGQEGAYNTDPTLTGANAVLVQDIAYKMTPGIYRTPAGRALQAGLYPAQVGNRLAALSFKSHLRGHTSALTNLVLPANHYFLLASGYVGTWDALAKTWTYVWDPVNAQSLWAEFEDDGLLQPVGGLRFDFGMEVVPGLRMVQAFDGQGQYQPVEYRAMTAPTYVAPPPMLCEGIAFAPFGDAIGDGEFGRIQSASLKARNELFRQLDPNAAEGSAEVHVTRQGTGDDSGPQLDLTVTRPGAGDQARWHARFLARTEAAACSMRFGSTTVGAKQTFDVHIGRLVVDSYPEPGAVGSVRTDKVTCGCYGTAAGSTEDALRFVWTQHP